MGVAGKLNDNADILAPGESYWPNIYGAYNLFGNAAEMIQEKGVAKGGSWIHDEKNISVERDDKYTEPNHWVGFRCVADFNKK